MSATGHQNVPSDLMYQLTKLGVLTVADPTAPALWVPGVKDASAFSANFVKEQRKTLRVAVVPRLKALSAQVASKCYQSPLPTVSDLWQAAAGTSYPGHRFAVVRELIGWSQEVISNELGKSNASALSNFECNPGASLGYLSDACSVIDVDERWILTGIAALSPLEAPSMPWLLPWWQATVEAHDFCDQLIQRSDEDHVDIIQNRNPAAALARWLKKPGTLRPHPQPWWEKQGSLLSWFVEASTTYGNEHQFTCAFTETSFRDLQVIVADWIALRAHLRRIPGLEEVLRSPSRVITDE